ncbi:MAG TPA: vWA domain-containing protein [Methanocella sp.]|uniref:vWA domain-containing protein n=1 Tax=Methanocella sp. TaxID=2052833 RepID=UPI002D0E6BC8|nr:vWA domain-containing protein [Methanocella sp.]HTY91970.1 vWA domain-containing protein [Methanocella sp.]
MIFDDDTRIREACAKCLTDPSDVDAYDDLMNGTRIIGRSFLRLYNIMPSMTTRMVYSSYSGGGIISFDRTISTFGQHGKTLDGVIARYRLKDVKKLNLAIMYDDSNSMTAWWRNKNMGATVNESQSPQSYAKVACLALMEGLGKSADISLWTFGSRAEGPYNASANMYRQLISRNGSGGTRLDLALQSLTDQGWHRKRGSKVIIVLTDGVPEVGRSVYAEDVLVNMKAFELIRNIQYNHARFLYIQLHTDDSRRFKKSGGYTMTEFGAAIEKMGGLVIDVDTANKISDSLFKGLQQVLKRR